MQSALASPCEPSGMNEPRVGTPLSPREREILLAVAHGRTAREIAVDLGIAHGTVKGHLYSTHLRLDVSTTAAAVYREFCHDELSED